MPISIHMAHVPCGVAPAGGSVTCVEAATLIGIQRWVTANEVYFKKTKMSNVLFVVGAASILLVVIGEPMNTIGMVIAVVFVSIGCLVRFSRQLVPIDFPSPVITQHPWVDYRGTSHLVVTSDLAQLQLGIKGVYPGYQAHDPAAVENPTDMGRGTRDFSAYSADSLWRLAEDVLLYSQQVESEATKSFLIQVVTGESADYLGSRIAAATLSAGQSAFCTSVTAFSQADTECRSSQTALNEISGIIDSNISANSYFRNQVSVDLAPYEQWMELLTEIGNEFVGTVLLSVEDAWGMMADASGAASKQLQLAVQDDLNLLRVKAEDQAIAAEAELDLKMADIKMANRAKSVDLESQIKAQYEVVEKARESSGRLRSMSVPSQISISIPVVTVSGGGGSVGANGGYISPVSSRTSHETVYFENPANHIRDQLLELAAATSSIEDARLDGLTQRKQGLSGEIDQHKEKIQQDKKEALAKSEESSKRKEAVALQHSHNVQCLFNDMEDNPALLDYRDLDNIISKVWARPSDHLGSLITPTLQDISLVMSVMDRFEVDIRSFESGLTNSSLSNHALEPLQVHWVWDASTKSLTENVVVAMLDIYEDAKVVMNRSNVSPILDPQIPFTQIPQMSDKMIMACIALLMKEGWFDLKLSKFMKKKKIHDYRNGSRPQAATAKQ
jgi:hypothetical protein